MKFRVGDIVRHVNGVKEFVVYTTDWIQCVYGLKEEGSPVVHYYPACHVDSMYRHLSCGEPSSSDPHVNHPEVVEEYEIDLCGETAWTPSSFHPLPTGISPGYTGRTRKVVVQ